MRYDGLRHPKDMGAPRAPSGEGGANRARAIQSIFALPSPRAPCGEGVRIVHAQSIPSVPLGGDLNAEFLAGPYIRAITMAGIAELLKNA